MVLNKVGFHSQNRNFKLHYTLFTDIAEREIALGSGGGTAEEV